MKTSLENRLFTIIRNFIEYDSYGKDSKIAIATLRKYHPELLFDECKNLFELYLQTYRDVVVFLEKNHSYYLSVYSTITRHEMDNPPQEEKVFIAEHPDVPEKVIRMMIYWIVDWYYIR